MIAPLKQIKSSAAEKTSRISLEHLSKPELFASSKQTIGSESLNLHKRGTFVFSRQCRISSSHNSLLDTTSLNIVLDTCNSMFLIGRETKVDDNLIIFVGFSLKFEY